MGRILLDTGPWVAILDRSDRMHTACRRFLDEFRGELFTTEAVLTETMHLLGRCTGGRHTCVVSLLRGFATLVPLDADRLRRILELLQSYRSIEMDFADASLVALAEALETGEILTLDRRDFSVYRWGRNRPFRIRPDWSGSPDR